MILLRKTIGIVVVLLFIVVIFQSNLAASEQRTQPFKYRPQNGDIVFQTSKSQLGPAIEIATGSKITHCGVTLRVNDTMFVYEAVGPVRRVPLSEWIRFGVGERFTVKRLHNATDVMTPQVMEKMLKAYRKLEGKDYDVNFEWSDERLYCSELVYKMFKRGAGIQLGRIERFGDFNLDDELVQFWINTYFPKGPNLKEKVVTPVSILSDTTLVTVFSNYR